MESLCEAAMQNNYVALVDKLEVAQMRNILFQEGVKETIDIKLKNVSRSEAASELMDIVMRREGCLAFVQGLQHKTELNGTQAHYRYNGVAKRMLK
jgi:hypothetical protein